MEKVVVYVLAALVILFGLFFVAGLFSSTQSGGGEGIQKIFVDIRERIENINY
ncbi:hypothetical protein Mfer_0024 [Methanothermus fervidus DSM 2088]|uniref:Uncharacterized protein n=1 Tax=Methanothermus fervidus (strain ATCC 43054 / DSM 2088 / JCM 10308 / V24 S) TaxID=523846 RepID=E3GWL4_METFV|nr:hypothetical protein [Methanothermus fervidus]ADP76828.1 hypothetical protein Mfer_0024 [Methanothermus fervidus DSM 2088]